MANPADPLFRTKWGVAVLGACIVETINESDPTFREGFLKKLTDAYYKLRDDSQNDELQGMELLSWTREALTGFDQIKGQGEPFFRQNG
jgi:hypothetical protein